MPELNCDLPEHFYALVRKEFLFNQAEGFGEFEECVVFGVASVPGRALGFHVLLQSGAQFARIPVHALAWHDEAPAPLLEDLEAWDCFGYHVTAHTYEYLRELGCRMLRDPKLQGTYVTTIDWHSNGYSNEPEQHKNLHLIKLSNGNFALQPNNRLLWAELSFTVVGQVPRYKRNTMVWNAERVDPQPQEHHETENK